MKKVILFLFVAMLATSMCFAQSKFEPQIKVGYDLGIDDDKNQSFGAEFLAGYRFNENFRLGVGTGVSWCKHLYEKGEISSITNKYYSDYKETALYIPLFVNGKFNFVRGGISPYMSLDLGYTFFIPCSDYADKNDLGFMLKPAFGVDFPVMSGNIFVELGYKYQKRDWKLIDNVDYSQLSIAVGYSF